MCSATLVAFIMYIEMP